MSRLMNAILAALGLALLAPVLAAAAAAILIQMGRPVLFRQQRVGRHGRPFTILKFRTMRAAPAGAQITCASDSRITPLGRFLRKYKLDELPQLWNVVKGDMSLVGPRPEVPRFVDTRDPLWQTVLSVPPGITDAVSLMYRDEEELLRLRDSASIEDFYRRNVLPEKLALNVRYLRARSLRLDLRLIVLTVWYSLLPKSFDPAAVRRMLSEPEASN